MIEHKQNMEAQRQRDDTQPSRADVPNIPPEVLHLVRVVADVEDTVMTCEACQMSLLSYVDDEIGGLDVARLYPDVKRHLDLCSDCMKEYVEMLEWGLAEDAAWQPVEMPILTPAQPKVSLPDYVRSVAEELISVLIPKRIGRFQEIADEFFERLSSAGESFVLQPRRVLSRKPNPTQFLVAAYATTQSLVQEWSISQVETEIRHGTLLASVREQAEKEARKQGFRKKEAQRFAKQYAEIVCQEPAELQSLLEG